MEKVVEKVLNEKRDLIYDNISNKDLVYNACNAIFYEKKEYELNNYAMIIKEYKLFLNKILNLLETLCIPKDDLSYAISIEYLIDNGYLSNNGKIELNSQFSNELLSFPGINVILGKVACRNISCFYEDLFHNIYNYPILFPGRLSKTKNLSYNLHHTGNHVINIVNYQDNLVGIDLFNHDIYQFTSEKQMYTSFYRHYLTYHSYYDLFNRGLSINDVYNKLNYFEDAYNNNEQINLPINNIKAKIYFLMQEKKLLLQSFAKDSDKIKKNITEKMLIKK